MLATAGAVIDAVEIARMDDAHHPDPEPHANRLRRFILMMDMCCQTPYFMKQTTLNDHDAVNGISPVFHDYNPL